VKHPSWHIGPDKGGVAIAVPAVISVATPVPSAAQNANFESAGADPAGAIDEALRGVMNSLSIRSHGSVLLAPRTSAQCTHP